MIGCTQCGGSGYRAPVRYGVGHGTGGGTGDHGSVIWADHAVRLPCACTKWMWSYTAPHWPQPIIVPLPPSRADG